MRTKTILNVLLALASAELLAQQPPTHNSPGPPANGMQDAAFWSRAGNSSVNGSNNRLGTRWNSPIYGMTNNQIRTRLNGTHTATVGPVLINTDGFFGIGDFLATNGYLANHGPLSLLHLEGSNNDIGAAAGYRDWMRTGMFINEHTDNLYIGLREIAGTDNRSDAMISWGDDFPESLRFSMMQWSTAAGAWPNPDHGQFTTGYQFMSMHANTNNVNDLGYPGGFIGIGPLFVNGVIPESRLHLHSEDWLDNYVQISSEQGSTGSTTGDGLRIGIENVPSNALQSGNALLYNMENRHLLFSTGNATPNNPVASNERMRLTSLQAPTSDPAGSYLSNGYNPGGNPETTVSRLSLSYRPAAPVTAPLSLLHMGANTSMTNDGWKQWMEVGTFVNAAPTNSAVPGANLYTGIKHTPAIPDPSMDAVITWGYSPQTVTTIGTRLRVVFNTSAGPFASSAADGLEAAQFMSDGNNTRLGVGNFAGMNPGNTLDIRSSASSPNWPITTPGGTSGLRLTHLTTSTSPMPNPGPGVLAVDSDGDVVYVQSSSSSSFGGDCNDPSTIPAQASDHAVNMNNFNFYWDGNAGGVNSNNVMFGKSCGDVPQGKVDILQKSGSPASTALYIRNEDHSKAGMVYGIQADVPGLPPAGACVGQVGGMFRCYGESYNVAVYGASHGVYSGPSLNNFGGVFEAFDGQQNIGGSFVASNGQTNWGIYAAAPQSGSMSDLAANFSGDVWVTGINSATGYLTASDKKLKTEVKDIENASAIIDRLRPKTYIFDRSIPQLQDQGELQYGLIAQEVQEVLPSVVEEVKIPAILDEKGKVAHEGIDVLGVKYDALIPVLIAALKEQKALIGSQVSANDDLKRKLDEQAKQIAELKEMIAGNKSESPQTSVSGQPVYLNDAIVLNQNVPNPFAESTVIRYNIPERIKNAKIVVKDEAGRELSSTEIKSRGAGQITVYAQEISNGQYSYSLFTDGALFETKKMIKQD